MGKANSVRRARGYCALCWSRRGCISTVEDGRLVAVDPERLGLANRSWNGDLDAAVEYILVPSGLALDERKSRPSGVCPDLPTQYRKHASVRSGAPVGFASPSRVAVITPHDRFRAKASLSPRRHPMVVSATRGWCRACETLALPGYGDAAPGEANVNAALGGDSVDPIGGPAPLKSYVCRVERLSKRDPPAHRARAG